MPFTPPIGPIQDQSSQTGPGPDQPDRSKRASRVLILEDDAQCAEILSEIVEEHGAVSQICTTVAAAKYAVEEQAFDFHILDQRLPDGTGTAFFYHLRERKPDVQAIILTGLPEVTQAVELTRMGLLDYLVKPFTVAQLSECLARSLAANREPALQYADYEFSCATPAMRKVLTEIRQAAQSGSSTILLTGETGVGKDVFARAIHHLTVRHGSSNPNFVSLNCATLPAEMFEAELFGAERGAYTGAVQQRIGLAEAAAGGTLFLDEIGEVPRHLQAKLLHLLENREFRRLGSTTARRFEGRIISATNQDLHAAVAEGRFRADLLYRLDVFAITIPPLRERREDIPLLARAILAQLCNRFQRSRLQIKPADLLLLQEYLFPGNIRELRNILERGLLRTPATSAWLQLDLPQQAPAPQVLKLPEPRTMPADMTPVEIQEYELIRQALVQESGRIRRAAARLSMSHQTLLRRLEKWPQLRQASSHLRLSA